MPARARFDRDYYALMGLPATAGDEAIRRAYRRLALQWHPDRNAGSATAAERFKAISEAYAVLIDPVKRREYDRARQGGGPREFRHSREDVFRDLFADPRASAIFEELAREFERLGMRVDRRDFHQTLFGGRAVITGGVFVITPLHPLLTLFRLGRAALRGARAVSPVPAVEPRSAGGILSAVGRLARGLLASRAPAGAAAGGDVVLPLRLTRKEAEHGGRRRVTLAHGPRPDEVLVRIPAGVRTGTSLRLRGKGRVGAGGTRGDAYLSVVVSD